MSLSVSLRDDPQLEFRSDRRGFSLARTRSTRVRNAGGVIIPNACRSSVWVRLIGDCKEPAGGTLEFQDFLEKQMCHLPGVVLGFSRLRSWRQAAEVHGAGSIWFDHPAGL